MKNETSIPEDLAVSTTEAYAIATASGYPWKPTAFKNLLRNWHEGTSAGENVPVTCMRLIGSTGPYLSINKDELELWLLSKDFTAAKKRREKNEVNTSVEQFPGGEDDTQETAEQTESGQSNSNQSQVESTEPTPTLHPKPISEASRDIYEIDDFVKGGMLLERQNAELKVRAKKIEELSVDVKASMIETTRLREEKELLHDKYEILLKDNGALQQQLNDMDHKNGLSNVSHTPVPGVSPTTTIPTTPKQTRAARKSSWWTWGGGD